MPQFEVTPTKLIMEALEAFGEAEPEACLIIYTADDGNLHWRTNTKSHSQLVGLLELTKSFILNDILKREDS